MLLRFRMNIPTIIHNVCNIMFSKNLKTVCKSLLNLDLFFWFTSRSTARVILRHIVCRWRHQSQMYQLKAILNYNYIIASCTCGHIVLLCCKTSKNLNAYKYICNRMTNTFCPMCDTFCPNTFCPTINWILLKDGLNATIS